LFPASKPDENLLFEGNGIRLQVDAGKQKTGFTRIVDALVKLGDNAVAIRLYFKNFNGGVGYICEGEPGFSWGFTPVWLSFENQVIPFETSVRGSPGVAGEHQKKKNLNQGNPPHNREI
jgi:hypothetical protein